MREIKLPDISLEGCGLMERILHLRDIYFRAIPDMCIERPRLIIRFALDRACRGDD
ncbi:MAG: hypothetical protein GWO38_01805 [Phycisphaerae bacterium]|nr:hypothetical protein [Phycisphaerae bacterium]NIV68698.1 hypothetical protein [Phycisphaerae bacterium]NIX26377.1 hypothetical protein [Phycisphaerae bacterium]